MRLAENHGLYMPPPDHDDSLSIWQCDCDDCADERDLHRARQTPEGETL